MRKYHCGYLCAFALVLALRLKIPTSYRIISLSSKIFMGAGIWQTLRNFSRTVIRSCS